MEQYKEYEIRLVSGSYSRKGDDVVIEFYGREKNGASITVVYSGFRPYFRIVEPPEGLIEELNADPDVISGEWEELFVDNKIKKCFRATIKFPWDVPKYKNAYKVFDDLRIRFTDADIPFVHRFLYDHDYGGCIKVRGKTIQKHGYTTDIVIEASEIENIAPFNPELKILSFDIENSIASGKILTICCSVYSPDGTTETFSIEGNEYEILEQFAKSVTDNDPDVITGYNIDGYDIPHILERAKINGINNLTIGRNFDSPRQVSKFWRVSGRIIADAWWNVKRTIKPKRETLAYVAKSVLGEEKMDVDASQIDAEWAKDSAKVIEYCKKDALLALNILRKINVLKKYMDLASVSMLTVEDVMSSGTSTLIDSLIIREAIRKKIAINLTHSGPGEKAEKITGGFVLEPQAGLYRWVVVLDFKSMYPSIIISNNICFTTICEERVGDIVSPVGISFTGIEKKRGIIPGLLETLMKDRDEAKRKMKSASDMDEKNYYNGLQEAIKVVMNTFYGVLASSFYRFTNPDIGASITAFARENIQSIIGDLKSEGHQVIYSDTDSIFVKSPSESLDGSLDFGRMLASRYTQKNVVLEFEKVLESYFTGDAKKRYFGSIAWPEQGTIVRGYETRRGDSFDIQVETLEDVMAAVMQNKIEDAVEKAKEAVMLIMEGKVLPEKLTISKSVKNDSFYKDPEAMANVQAGRKMRELGFDVTEGMKVAFIVTESKASPMVVEPYIDGREFKSTPDYQYYAERVALSVSRITEVLGTGFDSLMGRAKQKSLFDSFSSSDDERKKQDSDGKKTSEKAKAVKKTGEKLSAGNAEVTLQNYL